jgi:HD-GYP domain-containing protein (c-di-GMP phosphodiesterase class II)
MSLEEAVAVMRKGRRTHFDPEVLDLLLGHLDEVVTLRG